jgi:hypothetical protein
MRPDVPSVALPNMAALRRCGDMGAACCGVTGGVSWEDAAAAAAAVAATCSGVCVRGVGGVCVRVVVCWP